MPTTENPLATAAESVSVKVAWLKQKKDVNKRLPILEFDDQQFYTFDRRRTTFRMVKHSCSYPAPPHKVRMWCSSLGASPDLPSSMDLNSFINTFELITEEKHTLEMAHLTGGETIAFEMVQGEPVSELSTFLLGAQLKQSAGLLPAGAGLSSKILTAADKKKMKELTAPAVQQLEDLGVNVGAALAGAAGGGAPPFLTLEDQARIASVLKEQAMAAEVQRKKLADELIAEEEEEARKKESKKAKNQAKKQKQKEKKKEAQGSSKDDAEPEKPTSQQQTPSSQPSTPQKENQQQKQPASSPGGKGKPEPPPPPEPEEEEEEDDDDEEESEPPLTGLAKLIALGVAAREGHAASASLADAKAAEKSATRTAAANGENGQAADAALFEGLPEAAAAHLRELQKQVLESHAVIRALAELSVRERDAKEAALAELEALKRAAR